MNSTKRVHGNRITNTITKKVLSKAITAVAKRKTCGAVSYANEHNLAPAELIARLKESGVVLRRGRPRTRPFSVTAKPVEVTQVPVSA